MTSRGVAFGMLASIVTLVLCGCSTGPATDGPLSFDANEASGVCGPSSLYAHAALGTRLAFDGSETVTITRVQPITLDGLEYLGSKIMPMDPLGPGFMFSEHPPVRQFPGPWERAEESIGYSYDETANPTMVSEFRHTAEGVGSIEGLQIFYTAEGREYVATTNMRLSIAPDDCDEESE